MIVKDLLEIANKLEKEYGLNKKFDILELDAQLENGDNITAYEFRVDGKEIETIYSI